jgi:hypothetical protein
LVDCLLRKTAFALILQWTSFADGRFTTPLVVRRIARMGRMAEIAHMIDLSPCYDQISSIFVFVQLWLMVVASQ